MKKPSYISHPLKTRTGTSQRTRIIEALQSDYALIDGKTLADRLYLISEYARHVNFYEYKKNEIQGEFQELGNWTAFFRDSLPFQLAKLSKTSIADLETQFLLLAKELNGNPSKQALESLLSFMFNNLVAPTDLLYKTVAKARNSFNVPLLAIIKSAFLEPLKCYIAIYNASVTFLCVGKKKFTDYMNEPWLLRVEEVYALDLCIKNVKKGKKEAFLKAGDELNTMFYQMLSGLEGIVETAPDYIEESLLPLEESLQKRHEPHLALLFTFLELFKHFQGDLNGLGKKHLDFFYEKVLKIVPKDAVPDKAHIVFEVAKHLEEYPLPKDLLLKDGKDINKQDIQFGLDHEIILDKAQVKDLKTLSLYPIQDDVATYTEGVYVTTAANSVDGKGKAFKKDQSSNWSTLGSKYSKYIQEGNFIADEHPAARLGFVLSSPVLLLKEGKRTITISLDCDLEPVPNMTFTEVANKLSQLPAAGIPVGGVTPPVREVFYLTQKKLNDCIAGFPNGVELSIEAKTHLASLLLKNDPLKIYKDDLANFFGVTDPLSCKRIFTLVDENHLKPCFVWVEEKLPPLFKVSFSGEKEWLKPSPEITMINISPLVNGLNFEIIIALEPDFPSIVFFDEGKLEEKLDLKYSFPLVKVELNEEVKIICDTDVGDAINCCLKKIKTPTDTLKISPYHFLKGLILIDAGINVEVCGLKNLIVQNDENLQDVNKPIFPFGPRPKIDATFIIGSKEIFCKDWRSFRLNVEWKDRSPNFNTYYEAYNQNGSSINDSSFKIKASVLEEGIWKEHNVQKNLFTTKNAFAPCPAVDADFQFNGYRWNRGNFGLNQYQGKSMPFDEIIPLNVDSRKGFIRLKLLGEDFQHDRYAYVLAQQMFKLSQVADLIKLADFGQDVEDSCDLAITNETQVDILEAEFNNAGRVGGIITVEMVKQLFGGLLPLPAVFPGLDDTSDQLRTLVCSLKQKIEDIVGTDSPVLPNEPYTPQIKTISVDYKANAEKKDMDIVHLYPYENTSKGEDIEQDPTLFPFFDDEGTLFVGMEQLTPGGSLSLLFQLAEATADSEQDRAKINWHYLSNNNWIALKPDFDVISDETDGLTVSGVVTIAVPDAISKIGNTVMPDNFYWIKVSAAVNVKAVAETIGVHTQAARTSARFTELNDKNRLDTALEAGSIAKLVAGDFSVKKVEQLYSSFGGRKPEVEGHYYTRVSEHLKHKGRALMLNDYEKIVLEGFPEIYKAKCITHTMGLSANDYRRDLEIAPGYAVVTVIPDLSKLKSGDQIEPKAPVSLLEKIGDHIRKRSSVFARIKVMNPRYEYVNVKISVRLYRGKSSSFYSKQLKDDLIGFLAPWLLGDTEKIAFGQNILFSDVVGFVECLDYVDFIVNLELEGACGQTGDVIKPLTARSILTGGEICVVIDDEKCPEPINIGE